jgi:hypothetical protein
MEGQDLIPVFSYEIQLNEDDVYSGKNLTCIQYDLHCWMMVCALHISECYLLSEGFKLKYFTSNAT